MQVGQSADHMHVVEEWGRPVRPYGEWRFPYRPYSVPYQLWGAPFAGLNQMPWGWGPTFPGWCRSRNRTVISSRHPTTTAAIFRMAITRVSHPCPDIPRPDTTRPDILAEDRGRIPASPDLAPHGEPHGHGGGSA